MAKPKFWLYLFVCVLSAGTLYYFTNQHSENFTEEGEEEESHGLSAADKQLATWWWTKAYPDPTNITGKYLTAWEQAQELKRNTEALFKKKMVSGIRPRSGDIPVTSDMQDASYGSWTAIGPKVFGGRILSIAINRLPNSNVDVVAASRRTLFAGSASGGIWRSYTNGDGATAWHPVPTGTPVLGVASIVYKPGTTTADTSTLLAGTGEVYRIESLTSGANTTNQVGNIGRAVWKTRGTYGIGILKTTDAGKTWRNVMPKISSDLFAIQQIRYDPTDATGNRVYACATDGLYRSTDGGETWNKIWTATYVSDVIINPAVITGNEILVAAGNLTNPNKGIWKTTNGFATAPTKLTTGLPATFKGFINFDYDRGMVAAGIGGVYTGTFSTTSSGTPDEELYTSTNFGTSWTKQINTKFCGGQYWFAHDMEFNPGTAGTTPTQIILGGVNLGRYTLGTTATTPATSGNIGNGLARMDADITPGSQEGVTTTYVHDDVHDIEYLNGSSTTFYVACDGGIFRTTDNGANFVSCNGGLQVHQFYGPVAQSATTSVLFGGLQDNNVIRYNGTDWRRVRGGDGGPCMFKPGAEATVIVSNDARGIWQSTTSGTTQASFTNVLINLGQTSPFVDERTAFMAPIGVSKANSARMYVASDNIHISTNSGASFTSATGTPNNTGAQMTAPIESTNKPAFAMTISNLNANKLYLSMSPLSQRADDGLYYQPPVTIRKSTNGGTSFVTKSTGLPDRYVTDFAISETNDENVFITLGGFGTTHVYETTDGGTNWTPRGSGLPDVPFNTILIDPTNANILYAGSDFGMYVSPDKGVNWLDFNNGLSDATYVMDLAVAPGNKLRAATHGKGIFESPFFDLSVLPVTVVSFTGRVQGSNNLLQWTVRDEQALSHYVVERSTNNGRFEPLSTIAAKNSTSETSYAYTDVRPTQSYFYRLKSVNDNGSYTYSEVIRLSRDGVEELRVLGNPFRNEIQVQLSVAGNGKLQLNLYDMKGALIKREEVMVNGAPVNHTMRDLSRYPSGVYQLEAVFNRQRWTQRLVKQ